MTPHPTPVTAVLFDYGMVLSAPPNATAWAAMVADTNLTAEEFEKHYWAHRDDYDRGTLSGVEYWRAIASDGDLVLSPTAIDTLIAHDIDLWGDLNQPMLGWVHRLHAAGVRIGILSNMGDAMEAGLCNKHSWVANFDHHTWSHRLKIRKPEQAIYHAAITGLQTLPANILFIDDKLENIEAAHTAGMQAIQYTTHAAFEAEMHTRGLGYLLTPNVALPQAQPSSQHMQAPTSPQKQPRPATTVRPQTSPDHEGQH